MLHIPWGGVSLASDVLQIIKLFQWRTYGLLSRHLNLLSAQGVITPFDALEGFQRGVESGAASGGDAGVGLQVVVSRDSIQVLPNGTQIWL